MRFWRKLLCIGGCGMLVGWSSALAPAADAPKADAPSAHVPAATQPASQQWEVNDMSRPQPVIITPGTFSTPEQSGKPPSDAIVLFDGKDLSQWQSNRGGPPRWTLQDGYVQTVGRAGSLVTKQSFGDCQLHIEWMAPTPPRGRGQGRGNSGVYLMGRYEVQILDSYQNPTYADGMAGAIYGQYPPLVNAALPPGQWQTYDIVFRRPRFDSTGKMLRGARLTVMYNGVLVQDDMELIGPTVNQALAHYTPDQPDKAPLSLQDHGNPVRFRNIWLRELPDDVPVAPVKAAGRGH